MWAIRVLTGPQAGQVYPLKSGRNTIGRGPTCDVKLNFESLSREHASVYVTDDKIIVSDLNSRNGTFVNGVRVQNQKLNLGDKLIFLDLIVDLIQLPDSWSAHVRGNQPLMPGAGGQVLPPPPAWAGNAALTLQQQQMRQAQQMQYQTPSPQAQEHAYAPPPHSSSPVHQAQDVLRAYMDQVAMPGVYAFAQTMSYFQFIALMMLVYIFTISALSIVPMMASTKAAIMTESKRRAMTIARSVALANRQAVLDKNELALNLRSAELEEGVTAVMLVNGEDGTVIAPANERGKLPRDGFVAKARRDQKETEEIGRRYIKVAVPIVFYNEKISAQAIAAFAIVHYDTEAIALNAVDGLVLFVKTFTIALLFGLVLFYLIMKLIEHPIQTLNADLDDAIRAGRDDIRSKFQIKPLEALISNINTVLGRAAPQGDGNAAINVVFNRDTEATNVVRMIPSPAIAINAVDNRIIGTNEAFNRLAAGGQQLAGRQLRDIPDPALQENLNDLIPRMKDRIAEIALSEIPFFGEKYEICGQVVMGTSEPAWYLVTMNKVEGEG